jgi:hypothetical protein
MNRGDMIDVDALLELEAKATRAPWFHDKLGDWIWTGNMDDLKDHVCDLRGVGSGLPLEANGDLIETMRNSIRELCLELKAARKVADAARNYFTEHDLEGLSKNYFKDYHAVKRALEKLDEAMLG